MPNLFFQFPQKLLLSMLAQIKKLKKQKLLKSHNEFKKDFGLLLKLKLKFKDLKCN
jgi:hypothetical protein